MKPYIEYVWIILQVIIGLYISYRHKDVVDKFGSINTLVLAPICPILGLVLFITSRVTCKDYYYGYVFLLPLGLIVLLMKDFGPVIIVFSVLTTCIVYWINDGWLRVVISLIIGYICKDMQNPISFIISCNIFSDYIIRTYISTTNKYKPTVEGYDNDGINNTIFAGFLEAAFIGAPSDVFSKNKYMMDGLSDSLCILNFLVNGSQRGSATVLVTDWTTASIFIALIVLIYVRGNLEYIKEEDKVWPPVVSTDIGYISKLQLFIVTLMLAVTYSMTSYIVIIQLVLVIALTSFVRIKVVTSTFFSANLLFN